MIEFGVEVTVPKSPRIRLSESLALGTMGAEAARRIRHRVQDQAQGPDGQSFGKYRHWPKKLFVPDGGNQRFPSPRDGIETGGFRLYLEGYREYRDAIGKRGDVNFDLTGEMWRNQQVRVRLVYGYPVVIVGFRGSVGQRPRQDYIAQIKAKKIGGYVLRRRVGGRTVFTQHHLGARARQADPRPATPASKAAFQRARGGKLRWFMEMSGGELTVIRDMALKDIAEVLKKRWPPEKLPAK